MIDDPRGCIDYEESGAGPTLVLVPGSCSMGAAWRPMMATWGGRFRCVTTSLPGYGGTAERRNPKAPSIEPLVDAIEAVVRRAGEPVHLVGHSFGASVALATALRGNVPVASLSIVEAPLAKLLHECGEHEHYAGFRQMTDRYFAAFEGGDAEAIAEMIDFYGGAGTFASWPPRLRAYAVETTPVNLRDWVSGYAFPDKANAFAAISVPTLVFWGNASPQAVQRANAILSEQIPGAKRKTIDGAAHFMIATHAAEVAEAIAAHITGSLLS